MSKGGNGIGSASIILIFAVLCMTIFALISFKTAIADKALVDTQEQFVKEYYDADMRAEQILAEILKADTIPQAVNNVNIKAESNQEEKTVSFVCSMSDTKELYVEVIVYKDTYDIIKWKIQDTGSWIIDDKLPVWTGEDIN